MDLGWPLVFCVFFKMSTDVYIIVYKCWEVILCTNLTDLSLSKDLKKIDMQFIKIFPFVHQKIRSIISLDVSDSGRTMAEQVVILYRFVFYLCFACWIPIIFLILIFCYTPHMSQQETWLPIKRIGTSKGSYDILMNDNLW